MQNRGLSLAHLYLLLLLVLVAPDRSALLSTIYATRPIPADTPIIIGITISNGLASWKEIVDWSALVLGGAVSSTLGVYFSTMKFRYVFSTGCVASVRLKGTPAARIVEGSKSQEESDPRFGVPLLHWGRGETHVKSSKSNFLVRISGTNDVVYRALLKK